MNPQSNLAIVPLLPISPAQAYVDFLFDCKGDGGSTPLTYWLAEGPGGRLVLPASTKSLDCSTFSPATGLIAQLNYRYHDTNGHRMDLDASRAALEQDSVDALYHLLATDSFDGGTLNVGAAQPTGGIANTDRIALLASGCTIIDGVLD